eukprot:11222665-Lingulodinium_polyedra.AAC.1
MRYLTPRDEHARARRQRHVTNVHGGPMGPRPPVARGIERGDFRKRFCSGRSSGDAGIQQQLRWVRGSAAADQ